MDENTVFGAENAENMPKKPSKKPLRDFFDVFEAVILAVVASLFRPVLYARTRRHNRFRTRPARNRRQFRHSLRQKNHRRCGRPFGDKVR